MKTGTTTGTMGSDVPTGAREAALRLQARRAHSAGELSAKLSGRGYSEAECADALDWLAGIGYLDDLAYARDRAGVQVESGWGRRHILYDLRQRCVGQAIIEQVMDELPEMSEMIASRIARLMEGQDQSDPKQRRRVAMSLSRRGYSWDEIESGLASYWG